MRGIVRFVIVIIVGLATTIAPLAAGVPPAAAAAQSMQPAGMTVLESLELNGVTRHALVYVPNSLPANTPAPLVVFLHGNGIDMLYAIRGFGVREDAERAGFIAVFPNGTAPAMGCCAFNNGAPIWGDKQPPDDVAFIDRLLDLVMSKYRVDSDRVFATGISNGGGMSSRLACELSHRLAGVAVVAAARDASGCAITQPVSVLAIHGTADPSIPYAGGPDVRNVVVPSQAEIAEVWRSLDGCSAEPVTRMLTPSTQELTYGPCERGTEVRLYTVQDGMHCWPGVEFPQMFHNLCAPGGPHLAFKATPLIVDFFLSHPRQARP
jgi:polyhydroxybutyrate depolymerase